jgi:sulfur relay (sulfurtransferase) complex TusBCD TusD component (DsrE family)
MQQIQPTNTHDKPHKQKHNKYSTNNANSHIHSLPLQALLLFLLNHHFVNFLKNKKQQSTEFNNIHHRQQNNQQDGTEVECCFTQM